MIENAGTPESLSHTKNFGWLSPRKRCFEQASASLLPPAGGAALWETGLESLPALLIAAITFPLLRDAFAFRPAIGGQRAANVNLLFRRLPTRGPADIPLVTFVRLDQL